MNTVERVLSICKERGIAVSRLEKDLGFGNKYIAGLKKGSIPDDRLYAISEYLGVSATYLITGEEKEVPSPSLSEEYTELIELYSKLSKENQMSIMQIMRNLK